jgi:large subunit ribosomal protein L4
VVSCIFKERRKKRKEISVPILKKFDFDGQELGDMAIADNLIAAAANSQMIKDYLVAIRTNARQWSASTKTRAEVCHSGQKPHPQKGTGRARQGYLGAPHYKGGGRVHAPRPKFDQHIKINKQERRSAIRYLFCEKIKEGHARVLKVPVLDNPKTARVAQFISKLSLTEKRVLFLGEASFKEESALIEKYRFFVKSLQNLPKVTFSLLPNVSGYDLVLHSEIVIFEPALDELLVALGGKTSQ